MTLNNCYFYYYHEDALQAAEEYAKVHHGYIAKKTISLNDKCLLRYCDQESNDLRWSDEVDAIIVRDNDTHKDIACFASYTTRGDE